MPGINDRSSTICTPWLGRTGVAPLGISICNTSSKYPGSIDHGFSVYCIVLIVFCIGDLAPHKPGHFLLSILLPGNGFNTTPPCSAQVLTELVNNHTRIIKLSVKIFYVTACQRFRPDAHEAFPVPFCVSVTRLSKLNVRQPIVNE